MSTATQQSGLGGPGQAKISDFESAVVSPWRGWVKYSPYSPWNLHHITPPRPNDLPHDMDESPNGWADAFEDLLRASSRDVGGLSIPLADHHDRLRAARMDCVDHRTIDRRWLWLAGLRANGLLGAAYPTGSMAGKHLSQPLSVTQPTGWPSSSQSLDPRLQWLRALASNSQHPHVTFPRHVAMPEAGVGSHHHQGLDWPATDSWANASWRDLASEAFRGPHELPQTEEDVFLQFMRNTDATTGVLPKVAGLLGDSKDPNALERERGDWTRQQGNGETAVRCTPGKHVSTEKIDNSDGTTTIVTREEKVNGDGQVYSVKTVYSTVGPDGNEISRSTESSYSRSWGGRWSWSTGDKHTKSHHDEAKKEGAESDSSSSKKSLSSWLWK